MRKKWCNLLSKTNQKTSEIITGMTGLAHLELAADKNSKTFIKNLKVKPPLLIQKAIYHEPSRPKTAQVYLMSSAGGILQGDRLVIEIIARKNTEASITTQAATKIYKSENQSSLQKINVILEKNSYLEFFPKQIIPHKSAHFKQEVNFTIDNDATLLYSETISSGRIAYGEKFDFESLIFRLNAYDTNKKILFSDAMNIEPKNNKEDFEKLFGNENLYCSIYIISKKINSENLNSVIFGMIKNNPKMSCSQLPNNSGLIVRILSNSNEEISEIISEIKNEVRKHL